MNKCCIDAILSELIILSKIEIVFFSCLRCDGHLMLSCPQTHTIQLPMLFAKIRSTNHRYSNLPIQPSTTKLKWINEMANIQPIDQIPHTHTQWSYFNLFSIWTIRKMKMNFLVGFYLVRCGSNVWLIEIDWNLGATTQAPKVPAIQDDADGHLIYHTGDILHNRCSW